MQLGHDPSYWPEPWLHKFQEREAIMWAEGVADSAAKAEADVRRQAAAEGQQTIFEDMADMRRMGR